MSILELLKLILSLFKPSRCIDLFSLEIQEFGF